MRTHSKHILGVGLVLGIVCGSPSCQDALLAPLEFEVTVVPAEDTGSLEQMNDTLYRTPLGSTVSFHFAGEPDFISLQYYNFNEASGILSFKQLLSMNDNQDNMKLYISRKKVELSKTDPDADSVLIREHEWTDISSMVNWPLKKNDTATTVIDMQEYRGDSVVLAFCYDTRTTGIKQPMFTISNMTFTFRTVKDSKIFSTVGASSMVWQPFDMLQTVDSLVYRSTDQNEQAYGVWDVSFKNEDKTAFLIRQPMTNKTPNEDWLISAPLYIPRGKDDAVKTAAVKNYYLSIEDYDFTFDEAGEYTLTFIATNANYKQNLRTTKTFKFIVYE